MEDLRHDGQDAANGLGQHDSGQKAQYHCKAEHFLARKTDYQLYIIDQSQQDAHNDAYPQFLPENPQDIPGFNLSHCHAADNHGAALAARIAASICQHGNEGHQQRYHRKGRLVLCQDAACNHAADHENQKPGQTVLCQSKHACLKIRLLAGEHGCHLLKVLCGLLLHNIHHVVHGNDAHQTVLMIHHRKAQEVVLTEALRHLLLVVCGPGLDHM